MIRLRDALSLAGTKLRTRRIRTSLTIIISGLLFGALVMGISVIAAADHSLKDFSQVGLGSRYIALGYSDSSLVSGVMRDQSVIDRAQAIYQETINAKQAAAKKLGISYDQTTEVKPMLSLSMVNGTEQEILNITAPSSRQAISEYLNLHPQPGIEEFTQLAKSYQASDAFSSKTSSLSDGGMLSVMTNGQEKFDTTSDYTSNADPTSQIFTMHPLTFMPAELTDTYMLPGAAQAVSANEIPIIVPSKVAAQLLSLPDLPNNAPAEQKLARIREIYDKANGLTVSACYRNPISSQQIQAAVTAAEKAKTKDKDYQAPSLIYGLPAADSCGAAPVISDTRTKAEKDLAAKQTEFDTEFGTVTQPVQQKLVFRIVGLMPDSQYGAPSNSAAGIFQNLVNSSLNDVLAIPTQLYDQLPDKSTYDSILTSSEPELGFSSESYYAEFATADQARRFIDEKSCTTRNDGTCATAQKPFQLNAFGSNSIALDDLHHKIARIFAIVAAAVILLAIVIMASIVGRTLADSRHETAVFRAIGATRTDIGIIYSLYTFMLALWIALVALAIGIGGAYALDKFYWQPVTVDAQLAFGGSNTNLTFHLFAIPLSIAYVALAVIITGLVSMILPITRSVRRSPIKDLRDE